MFKLLDWKSIGIAAIIAFVIGIAAGGWGAYQLDQARVLRAERDADRRVGELTEAYDKRDAEALQAVLDKQASDRKLVAAIDAKGEAEDRLRQAQFITIFKGNHDVKEAYIASGRPVHFMPVGWVLQYDSSFAAPSGQAGGDPGAPQAAPAGTSVVASDISEWDVLDNHAINAERWSACRRQVNDLLDILDKTD